MPEVVGEPAPVPAPVLPPPPALLPPRPLALVPPPPPPRAVWEQIPPPPEGWPWDDEAIRTWVEMWLLLHRPPPAAPMAPSGHPSGGAELRAHSVPSAMKVGGVSLIGAL